MPPFLAQYLPTERPGNVDNQSMKDSKASGFKKGKEWMSKYLFHLPLGLAFRKSKKKAKNPNEDAINISERAAKEAAEAAHNTLDLINQME